MWGGGCVNYSPGIFSKDQFSWFTLPSWLATGDSLMNKCFLRSIGVSPLVLRLSIGISTFPRVGWAIASPCITVRSLRATLSVQVLLRVEILATLRMILYSYVYWKRLRVNSRGYGRQNCGAISPVHFLPRAVGSVSPLPGRKLLVARLGGYV